MTIPTADELYTLARAEVLARNPALTDWTGGSVLDALTGSGVILADQVIRICIGLFVARFIATAKGADLDAAVTDLYPELTRHDAVGAIGTLTFERGTTTGAITIPAATVCSGTVAGTTYSYATDDEVTMGADDDTVDAIATALATGPTGNLAADTVTVIVSSISDDTEGDLTVTNTEAFAGGAIEETDDAYRARAQAYPATLSDATPSALVAAAISVPGVAYATVDESDLPTGGPVYVYIADASGNSNDAQETLARAAVDLVRAAGVLVTVSGATPDTATVALAISIPAAKQTSALGASIVAAVLAYINALPPGTDLYLSRCESAAIGVSTDILGAVATSEDADGDTIAPSARQNTLRATADTVPVSWVTP